MRKGDARTLSSLAWTCVEVPNTLQGLDRGSDSEKSVSLVSRIRESSEDADGDVVMLPELLVESPVVDLESKVVKSWGRAADAALASMNTIPAAPVDSRKRVLARLYTLLISIAESKSWETFEASFALFRCGKA